METLQWENIHKNNFAVFIRDLSDSLNINLKHMIEDLDKEILCKEDSKKNNKKKKHIKKKDIIIQEQNKLREQEYFRSKGEKRRIAKAAGKARAKKEAQRKLEEYGF